MYVLTLFLALRRTEYNNILVLEHLYNPFALNFSLATTLTIFTITLTHTLEFINMKFCNRITARNLLLAINIKVQNSFTNRVWAMFC